MPMSARPMSEAAERWKELRDNRNWTRLEH